MNNLFHDVAIEKLELFYDKHLKNISKEEILQEDYRVGNIKLLDLSENEYDITILVDSIDKPLNSKKYLLKLIDRVRTIEKTGVFVGINSLYRQLRESDVKKNIEAIRSLGDLLTRLAEIGAKHITYDGFVFTEERYRVSDNLFSCEDKSLRSKRIEVYSFVPNILEGIIFEPEALFEFLNSKKIDGKINFQVKTENILEIVVG